MKNKSKNEAKQIINEWLTAKSQGVTQNSFAESKSLSPRTLRSWIKRYSTDATRLPQLIAEAKSLNDRLVEAIGNAQKATHSGQKPN